jgi:hypothetical protein
MDEWDPRNPESPTVRYDLADWSLDERVELVELLAEADIRHDWDGTELMVPASAEATVDAILDEVEDADDAPAALTGELDEFELDEWTTADRVEFAAVLVDRGIGHRWEDNLLLVRVDDADAVEDLLDEFDR